MIYILTLVNNSGNKRQNCNICPDFSHSHKVSLRHSSRTKNINAIIKKSSTLYPNYIPLCTVARYYVVLEHLWIWTRWRNSFVHLFSQVHLFIPCHSNPFKSHNHCTLCDVLNTCHLSINTGCLESCEISFWELPICREQSVRFLWFGTWKQSLSAMSAVLFDVHIFNFLKVSWCNIRQ